MGRRYDRPSDRVCGVIVRVSGEGQYRLDDACLARLDELDDATVRAVERGDEAEFHERFAALLSFIRSEGEALGVEELTGSDVILPPPDLSLREAAQEFSGEGLIPE